MPRGYFNFCSRIRKQTLVTCSESLCIVMGCAWLHASIAVILKGNLRFCFFPTDVGCHTADAREDTQCSKHTQRQTVSGRAGTPSVTLRARTQGGNLTLSVFSVACTLVVLCSSGIGEGGRPASR